MRTCSWARECSKRKARCPIYAPWSVGLCSPRRAKADRLAAQLDASIEAAAGQARRLRLLDAEIAKLTGERGQARMRSIDATAERLYVLDRATVESGTAAFSETVAADGHVLYEQVQERESTREAICSISRCGHG